jgi:hypothetical protein
VPLPATWRASRSLSLLVAPPKDRPVSLALPALKRPADVLKAYHVLAQEMSEGRLTPSEAGAVAAVFEGQRKAAETIELEQRIAALEAAEKRQ